MPTSRLNFETFEALWDPSFPKISLHFRISEALWYPSGLVEDLAAFCGTSEALQYSIQYIKQYFTIVPTTKLNCTFCEALQCSNWPIIPSSFGTTEAPWYSSVRTEDLAEFRGTPETFQYSILYITQRTNAVQYNTVFNTIHYTMQYCSTTQCSTQYCTIVATTRLHCAFCEAMQYSSWPISCILLEPLGRYYGPQVQVIAIKPHQIWLTRSQ